MTTTETNNPQRKIQLPLLSLASVSKSYPSGNGNRLVLSDVSIEVTSGETLAIVGPSGSGKTTLLNIIATLDKPDSGNVVFESTDLLKFNAQDLAHFRNRKIGNDFSAPPSSAPMYSLGKCTNSYPANKYQPTRS